MASNITSLGLIPIRNFGILQDRLYRSAQPMYGYEYAWLKNMLGLKHIISLRSECFHDEYLAPMHDIKVTSITVKDHFPPENDHIKQFLDVIKKNEPTLFHCEHGHGRTSTFSVIAKMRNGMSVEEAIQHEKDFFHYEFKHKAQEEFLRDLKL